MNTYASVILFDRYDCSVNEIAEFLSFHEWEVRKMLRDHREMQERLQATRRKPKRIRPKRVWSAEVLWRAPDYHGEEMA